MIELGVALAEQIAKPGPRPLLFEQPPDRDQELFDLERLLKSRAPSFMASTALSTVPCAVIMTIAGRSPSGVVAASSRSLRARCVRA